jgi:hypothetical protein
MRTSLVALLFATLLSKTAHADPMRMGPEGEYVMGSPSGDDTWSTRPAPMLMPIRTMMPGTWATPGTWQAMGNITALVTNPGFESAYDSELGETHPYVLADWIMARGRTKSGYFEGLLMLDFEALTLTRWGWYEVGQGGHGLWDRQHQHQLLHQALLAVHLMGDAREGFLATLWGGQGSAPIGPPSFMHRASAPSYAVPRKHHKGEMPHESFPVIGATLEYGGTSLDIAAFSAKEPGPDDSRLRPYPAAPGSFGARLRQRIGGTFEAQLSGAWLGSEGPHQGTQLSASIYGRWVDKFVIDALLDGAVSLPSGPHVHAGDDVGPTPDPHAGHAGHEHLMFPSSPSAGVLAEATIRSGSLRDVLWSRMELNQRVEPRGDRSSPWWLTSLGYERVVWVDPLSVLALGVFGEATYVVVPSSLREIYGDRTGITATAGLMGHFMYMPEHMGHDH